MPPMFAQHSFHEDVRCAQNVSSEPYSLLIRVRLVFFVVSMSIHPNVCHVFTKISDRSVFPTVKEGALRRSNVNSLWARLTIVS